MQQHQFKYYVPFALEKFEDTKGLKSQIEGQTIQWTKRKGAKRKTMIHKTLCRKLNTEPHEPH